MKSLFSFLIPVYFMVALKLWTPTMYTKDVVQEQPAPVTASAMMVAVTLGSNSPVCSGATLDIIATPSAGTAPYTYAWSGPSGPITAGQILSIANATPAATGTYTVTVTDNTSATASATIAVSVFPAATVNAGPDQTLCRNANAQLAGSFGGGATSAGWTASVPGGTFIPNNSLPNAVYDPPNNFSGNITLTYTTNDPAGPCPAVSDQVLLQYGNPDALVCNDEVTIAMDEDCSVTVDADMFLEGDVPEALYEVNLFTLQGVNIGNTITSQYVGVPLKARVRDNCTGNICFTNVFVEDNLPPVFLTCQNVTVPCAVTNLEPSYLTNVLGIAAGTPTVYENCSNVTLTKFDTYTNLGCNDLINGLSGMSGYIRRVWTAKDASNNSSTCVQFIYQQRIDIDDIQIPTDVTVDCSVMVTNPNATGVPFIQAFGMQFGLFPSNTACEILVDPEDQELWTCAGEKSIVRTWTIVDLCPSGMPNNPQTFTQLINVVDNNGPTFTCPANTTVSTDALECCASFNIPPIIMSDACSYVSNVSVLYITTHPISGDTINIQVASGSLVGFPGNNLNNPDTMAVFPTSPCLPIGNHSIVIQAEDACGAVSSCSFRLTVNDGTPPLAVCDEITQVALGIDGMAFVFAETFDDGSYDNCSPVFFKARRADVNACQPNNRFYDAVKFCCEDIGDTVTVIMRVYDIVPNPGEVSLTYEEQHSNDCTVQVYVEDKLKPICIPPANVTVSCENFDPTLWAHGQPSAVDNCCLDTITTTVNYTQFDTTCNKGTITRTFRAFDCFGNSNVCTQRITVNYKQDFYVKFPNDVIITVCDGTGQYGAPTFNGEDCELMAVSYDDAIYTVVPDACFKIERTWTIINWCTYNPNNGCTYVPNPNPNMTANHPSNLPGPTVSAFGTPSPWAPTVVRIDPSDTQPTNFSQFYNPNVNCYRYKQIIKVVDTQKPTLQCPASPVEVCDLTANDVQLWNNNTFINVNNGSDLCEAPADICVTGTDACSGTNVNFHYLLFLDLNNDGVMETVVKSLAPPTPGTVAFNNLNTPNYNGGISTSFDQRNVNAGQKYNWTLQTSTIGNNVTACLKWNTLNNPGNYVTPQLPLGKHKIKWFITDGCGNESVCEYLIEVEDCKAPTITCLNGLSINIMQSGMATVFVSQFVQNVFDDCTPTNLIQLAIRKSGSGTGFPTNPNGTPQTSVTFTCAELGTQLVEIWAKDQFGNADFCETYILVQDNGAGNCGQSLSVAGAINTENGHGVEDAYIELNGTPTNGLPSLHIFNFSDQNGSYKFNSVLPAASDYTLMPVKDNDPLNGVNTYDLVLISRNILGIEPFDSPFKLIAADVNKSGTVTTFDIVELRKLIMGTYSELPSNASWRFVDANYTFPDPNNPFQEVFPETRNYQQAMGDMMEEDFVAVKIGDVDNTNIANNLMSTDDRAEKTVYFEVEDKDVQPGEVVTASLQCAEDILGYQMTVQLGDVDLLAVVPGDIQNEEHFAMFPDRKAVTSSWDGKGKPAFKIQFRSNVAGKLSDLIAVSSSITRAEAYDLTEAKTDIALRFSGVNGNQTIANVGFELYQNQPNPFLEKTVIGFHLPDAAEVKLTIFDENGRLLLTETGNYPRGYNRFLFDTKNIEATTSMLYYRIETPQFNATKKMLRTR